MMLVGGGVCNHISIGARKRIMLPLSRVLCSPADLYR